MSEPIIYRDVFSLDEGCVVLQYPPGISDLHNTFNPLTDALRKIRAIIEKKGK